jgi:hypothetical protein
MENKDQGELKLDDSDVVLNAVSVTLPSTSRHKDRRKLPNDPGKVRVIPQLHTSHLFVEWYQLQRLASGPVRDDWPSCTKINN